MKMKEQNDSISINEINKNNIRNKQTTQIKARVNAKRALIGAGARVLFYPTLLYNVLRYKIEPQFRWWDQIDQFVLLGAVPFPKDVARLKKLGVGAVITLNEPYETLVPTSLYHAHGIDHLVIPTTDYLYAPSLVDISQAVDFIHRNASCGRTTYVHCKAGRGRSTTIVLCYLVEYMHMTPAAALEYVRCRRPRVLQARSQWKAVHEYTQQRVASKLVSSPVDAVLITKADPEGHQNPCNEDSCKDLRTAPRIGRTRPVMPRLCCFYASRKS